MRQFSVLYWYIIRGLIHVIYIEVLYRHVNIVADRPNVVNTETALSL